MTEQENPDTENKKDLKDLVGTKKFLQDKIRQIQNRQEVQHEINWVERQLHKYLGLCSKKYYDKIYESKGFLTKEDGYLDYNEWHTASLSALLGILTHFTSVFLLIYLIITKKVLQDEFAEHSTLSEIDGELPYWIGFYGVTLIIDIVVFDNSLPRDLLLSVGPKLLGL